MLHTGSVQVATSEFSFSGRAISFTVKISISRCALDDGT